MTPYPVSNRNRVVYFVRSQNLIKIGTSVCVEDRLKEIQKWCPYELELLATVPGTQAVEFAIQGKFVGCWSHGEWFNAEPPLLAFIDQIKNGEFPDIPLGNSGPNRRGTMAMLIEAWRQERASQ